MMMPHSNTIHAKICRWFGVLFTLLSLTALNGCSGETWSVTTRSDIADTVFLNGRIYTVYPQQAWAKAVAVKDNKIVYVGDNPQAQEYIGESTRVIDLHQKLMLPGLHDTHLHLPAGLLLNVQCGLHAYRSQQEIFDRLRECAKGKGKDEWIIGEGWAMDAFPGSNPGKESLDEVLEGRPAYLIAEDGHNAWVTSRALEIAGVDKQTPEPEGGIVMRKANGEPSGTLRETAMLLVKDKMPIDDSLTQMQGLVDGMREANRHGIVAITDAMVEPNADHVYKTMEVLGLLTTRVTGALISDYLKADLDKKEALLARFFKGSDWLRGSQAKIFVDGVMESHTAAIKQHYIGLDHKGIQSYGDQALNEFVAELEAHGFQVHLHAIGNAAIKQALDALEYSKNTNGKPNNRPVIAHNYLIDENDFSRMKALGVSPNFTMLWAQQDNSMLTLNRPFIPKDWYNRLMPMAEAAERGVNVTGASDWPVTTINPFDSIQVAITGKGVSGDRDLMPGKRPDLETMIKAYTLNAARATYFDDISGSIEVGKRADLVVVNQDLFKIPPEQIHVTKVLLTMVDGKAVYNKLF